jgi:poly-gamma-glutamate synthesis protein (capsule biosynthesis protein)
LCEFSQRDLRAIKLYPVDLGFGRPRSQRGRPLLADADSGKKIVDRIARLSERHGTSIHYRDGAGVVQVK